MSENIVKFVDKIPFSENEFHKALENRLLLKLYEMEQILLRKSNHFKIKDMDVVCCFNENDYFLFRLKEQEIVKSDFDPDYDQTLIQGLPVTAPEPYHISSIYSAYKSVLTQKRKFNFVGDLKGKTVWFLNDGKYEKTDWNENDTKLNPSYPVFVSVLENTKTVKALLLKLIKSNIEPEMFEQLSEDFSLMTVFSDFISIENDRFKFDTSGLENLDLSRYESDIYQTLLSQMGITNPNDPKNIIDSLLNCEKIRCDMEKYPEALITGTDADAGLWNFWTDEETLKYGYKIPEGLKITARDPVADIVEDGIIAIDFGTSSTVVVRRNQNGIPIQMSIGKGDKYENPTLMKIFSLEKFMSAYKSKEGRPNTKWEDLWVSHAVYDIFAGKSLKEEEVSSILYQIKQWAANDKKNTVIKPVNDSNLTTLKSLTDLLEGDDFNPIEVYAYFIGLYINNRLTDHGIYLNYYMSFPSAYDSNTKKNILQSFEKGLKKSIPESVFSDGKHELKVHMDVSEPEAYAACALKTFGFIPSEEKPVNYAIFDFGGGTADFAYGYWKKPGEDDRENFSFEIENITTDGDKYLGGENLLEGLAFEVFADEDNRKKLDDIRSNPGYDCRFNYGIPEQETRGIPVRYLSNQQPAKKNMREMAEEMRKYWENEEDYFSELLHNGKKSYSVTDIENIIASLIEKVNLAGLISAGEELEKILESVKSGNETPANAFLKIERIKKNNDISLDDEDPDTINFSLTLSSENIKDGEDKHGEPAVSLSYSKKKIYDYFESKIKDGVDSFFSKLEYTFFEKDPTSYDGEKRVNIFLAGNSSRSPILRKVMEEKILSVTTEFKSKSNVEPVFKIYSPLGSEKVFDEMNELLHEQNLSEERIQRKLKLEKDKTQKPTGKTGVAFGLIDLVGGNIKVNSIKKAVDTFMFYLGTEAFDEVGVKIFKPITFEKAEFKGKPELGHWYPIINVNESKKDYIIRYTTDPKCLSELGLEAEKTKLKTLSFPQPKKGEKIFIRACGAKEIEYAIARDESAADSMIRDNNRKTISFE